VRDYESAAALPEIEVTLGVSGRSRSRGSMRPRSRARLAGIGRDCSPIPGAEGPPLIDTTEQTSVEHDQPSASECESEVPGTPDTREVNRRKRIQLELLGYLTDEEDEMRFQKT
jgi:hypothetical protein